jgi:hypothetical protein
MNEHGTRITPPINVNSIYALFENNNDNKKVTHSITIIPIAIITYSVSISPKKCTYCRNILKREGTAINIDPSRINAKNIFFERRRTRSTERRFLYSIKKLPRFAD